MKDPIISHLNDSRAKSEKFIEDNIIFFKTVHKTFSDTPEPETIDDATKLLHTCINSFEADVLAELQNERFQEMLEMISDLKKEPIDGAGSQVMDFCTSIDYEYIASLCKTFGTGHPRKSVTTRRKVGAYLSHKFDKILGILKPLNPTVAGVYAFFHGLWSKKSKKLSDIVPLQLLSSFYAATLKICKQPSKGDRTKKALIEHNICDLLKLLTKLALIQDYRCQRELHGYTPSLLFLTGLISIDISQINELFLSEDYAIVVQKTFFSVSSKKGWSKLESSYTEAVAIATQMWENGDERLHFEMAKDLLEEINEPIRDKILEELLNKYPTRDTDEKKKKFDAEKNKRFDYETMSFKTLKEKLTPIAIFHKKYFDPSAKHRNK